MVDIWTEPPDEVVEAGTVTAFKILLDRYVERKGLVGFGPGVGKCD